MRAVHASIRTSAGTSLVWQLCSTVPTAPIAPAEIAAAGKVHSRSAAENAPAENSLLNCLRSNTTLLLNNSAKHRPEHAIEQGYLSASAGNEARERLLAHLVPRR